jgi:hypothetical protein
MYSKFCILYFSVNLSKSNLSFGLLINNVFEISISIKLLVFNSSCNLIKSCCWYIFIFLNSGLKSLGIKMSCCFLVS